MAGQFEYFDFINLEGVDSSSEESENAPPCAPRLGNSGIQGLPVQKMNPTPTPTKKQRRKTAPAEPTLFHPEGQEDPDDGAFIKGDGQVDSLINHGRLPNDRNISSKMDSPPYCSPTEDSSSSDSEDLSVMKDDDDEDFDPDLADFSDDSALHDESEDDDRDLGLEGRESKTYKIPKILYSEHDKSCHYCPMKFESLPKARRHMKSAHKQYRKGICGICKKRCSTKVIFARHLQSHDAEKLKVCHICGAAFLNMCVLNEHMAYHTNPIKTLACPICSKLFKTERHLKKHKKIHDVYTCDFCSKTLKGRLGLLYHIRAHINSAAFECVHCGATFSQKDNRDTHMRNNHNIICLVCGGKYFTVDEVKKHLKKDHSKKEVEAIAGNGSAFEKVTRFQCEVCSRYLASKQSLDFHMATHTGSGKKRPASKKKQKLD